GEQSTKITVRDDDIATLSVSDFSGLESELSTAPPAFTVSTDNISSEDINVSIAISDITTTAGEDYGVLGNQPISVVIPAGQQSVQVSPVNVIDDAIAEDDEQFSVEITEASISDVDPSRVIIGDSGLGTILGDEVVVALSSDLNLIEENGGQATITASLNRIASEDVTVNLGFDGTATIEEDYALSSESTTITIPTGQTTGSISLTAMNDDLIEVPDETVEVAIASTTNATEAEDQAVTITIQDTPPPPSNEAILLSITDAALEEGDVGITNFVFTLSTNVTLDQDITASIFTSDITATAGEDYTPLANQTVVIPANQSSVDITIPVAGDAIAEADESFGIIVTQANINGDISQIGFTDPFGLGTILDDDPTPPTPGITISETDGTTLVGEGGLSDSYTIVLDSQPTSSVEITLNPDNQLVVNPTSITFTPDTWNTVQTVAVSAVEDDVAEGAQSVSISHTVESEDANYDGIANENVDVAIAPDSIPTAPTDPINVLFIGNKGLKKATDQQITDQQITDQQITDQQITDQQIIDHLTTRLGGPEQVTVEFMDDDQVKSLNGSEVNQPDLILISETAQSSKIGTTFTNVTTDIMTWEPFLYDDLDMTGGRAGIDFGFAFGNQVDITNAGHGLANGLTDEIGVYGDRANLSWARPGTSADIIATLPDDSDKATIFAYDEGSTLVNGTATPGKRLGFFLHGRNNEFTQLTDDGLALFDAAIDYMVS
ncbi:MAG: hypothetical protein F6K09_08950, partial [Merismopedia sp. SIO2A8]|nr:hypothetical protein [Merismopedia sp. SIO2A8]